MFDIGVGRILHCIQKVHIEKKTPFGDSGGDLILGVVLKWSRNVD